MDAATAAARICRTLTAADGSSLNKQWFEFELTCTTYTVQQHDVDDTTTRKSDQGKAWSPTTRGARVAEDDIQEQSPTPENNTHGLEERMHSCNEATQRSPQRHASPTSNYQFLRDTRDNTAHMVFEGEPAVKLQSKNIEVGTRANGNPIQDQVTMGRVHSRGSANH